MHIQIASEDEQISDDAADLSVQVGKISGKLKELNESQWGEGSNYLAYSEVVKNVCVTIGDTNVE
ncbi:MAG: hypothetical protein V4732_22665 [Pseudomonadota bacterium]